MSNNILFFNTNQPCKSRAAYSGGFPGKQPRAKPSITGNADAGPRNEASQMVSFLHPNFQAGFEYINFVFFGEIIC